MGNPRFSIDPLKEILKSRHDICAIISNPPKRMGRKKTRQYTDVGQFAIDNRIRLIELGSFKDEDTYEEIVSLKWIYLLSLLLEYYRRGTSIYQSLEQSIFMLQYCQVIEEQLRYNGL